MVLLEGGYSLEHAPFRNLAIVEALAGLPPSFVTDPIELDVPERLRTVNGEAIEATAGTYARWWP